MTEKKDKAAKAKSGKNSDDAEVAKMSPERLKRFGDRNDAVFEFIEFVPREDEDEKSEK